MPIFLTSRPDTAAQTLPALAQQFHLKRLLTRTPTALAPYVTTIYEDRAIDFPALSEAAHALMVECAQFTQLPRWTDYRLLVCDMDSTLITIECIDELGAYLGLKEQIAAITMRSMRGEVDFSNSLLERVRLLKGTPVSALNYVVQEKLRYTEGAQNLVTRARAAQLHTAIVSGGFTYFTQIVLDQLGMDAQYANVLEIDKGVLTGRLINRIVDAQAKADLLCDMAQKIHARPDQAIAVGDGANDLKMMAVSGLSVGCHAKPSVRAAAHQRVNHLGLDVLCAWLE